MKTSKPCKTAKAVPRGKLIALNTHRKTEGQLFKTLNIELPYDPASPPLGITQNK